MILVTRLMDGERRYTLEKIATKTAEEAHEQAQKWWRIPAVVAVLVEISGKEDARYMRPHFDKAKCPPTWPEQKTVYGTPVPEAVKPPEDVPLTAFNEEPPPAVEVPAPAPGLYVCWTCKSMLPADGYEGEGRDRTPSGRLEDMRCPECGKPLPQLSRRAILQLYLTAQGARARAEQAQAVRMGRRPV